MFLPRLVLLTLVAAVAGCSDPTPTATPTPNVSPDVVFITIDTLRRDHVGAFNPDSPAKTPHMDRLARDGVRFTDAWSPISVTGPAFASLLTGQSPEAHGVLLNLFRGGQPLGPEHLTLAEQLKSEGYRTGAFVSGFTLRRDVGLDQGFDTYDEPPKYRRWGRKTAKAAVAWLQADPSNTPAFVWYHSYDPHGPLKRWTLPDEHTRQWKRGEDSTVSPHQRIEDIIDADYYSAKYALAVEFADRQVGRILQALDQSGRYDSALIVFVADHGEGFDERTAWFEHGSDAYAEQLHIPMMIKYPQNTQAGSAVDHMVTLMDVVPTVRRVLGLAPLPGITGRDVATPHTEAVRGESSHCKPWKYANCAPEGGAGKVLVTRSKTATLLRHSTPEGAIFEQYDRTKDPRELTPVAVTRQGTDSPVPPTAPSDLRRPLEALIHHRTTANYAVLPKQDAPQSQEDEQEIDNLRALGYVE